MLDYCEQLIAAATAEDIWALHVRTMTGLGFDGLFYGFTRFNTLRSFGNPNDFLVMSNHPHEYIERYVNEGHYLNAPMVRWAKTNTGACSWRLFSEAPELLTPAERRVYAFNKDHGVTVGYSISFPDSSLRNRGGIGLSMLHGQTQDQADAIWAEHGRKIEAMNYIMHLKLIQMPYAGDGRQLTGRQREVLEWARDGKTTQDIALIMGLTVATVEKHLRLAREALDVDSTAQAVLKASLRNQIFVLNGQGVSRRT